MIQIKKKLLHVFLNYMISTSKKKYFIIREDVI